MISSLINTKRLGRYHNIPSNNSDNDNSRSQSLFSELESLHKDNSRMASIDFNKPLFGNKYTSLQKLLENANKTTEKATKFLNKIKSMQLAYANRSKSIPKNATIRKEYIKCGKEMCKLKHGPYYYAYWKDHETKKLKKKYIGDHMPDKKESNKIPITTILCFRCKYIFKVVKQLAEDKPLAFNIVYMSSYIRSSEILQNLM